MASQYDLAAFRGAVQRAITPYLGHFRNSNRPAIWVDAGNAPSSFEGLGCLIHGQPVRARSEPCSGGAHVSGAWSLILQQRDRSPPGMERLDLAVKAVRVLFPDVRNRERSDPTQDGDFPEVAMLIFFDYFQPK